MSASVSSGAAAPDLACPAHEFRSCLGRFATGVTVVTALGADGRKHGVTATSFGSLSLDPPLVQWSLRTSAYSHPIFAAADRFAINILAADQEEVSRIFSSQIADRFAITSHHTGAHDVPLLDGALAWIECALDSQLPGGDHSLFIGRVLSTRVSPRPPLLHWGGTYHRLHAGAPQ